MAAAGEIDRIVAAVVSSANYKNVSPGFVRRVAEAERSKARSFKETVKAVKNKLHQVGGAYQPGQMNYTAWLENIRRAVETGDPEELRLACARTMAHHASTKERLDFVNSFYREIFANIPRPGSILDVACGLNPLAFPWMNLPKETRYLAVDIYQDMIGFLNGFFTIARINGSAEIGDVIEFQQSGQFDLALALKTIPCLEQVDKNAGKNLLERIEARIMVVSYPARSLGGRSKGMVENYEAQFTGLIRGKDWAVRKLLFPNELVFIVEKGN